MLTKREDWSQDKVAEIILELSPGIGDYLLELLMLVEMEPQRKYLLVELLGYFKHLPALKPLTRLLANTEDDELKIKIIKTLGELSSPTSISIFKPYLAGKNWRLRNEVVKSLGKIGDADLAQPLNKMLSDENRWVRYNAAWSLIHTVLTHIWSDGALAGGRRGSAWSRATSGELPAGSWA